jgi:DNA-binding LytR/AlgR family response regulator
MIRAIIIDDESRARSALKQEITLNCPEVMIVGEADSVQSSVELIKKVVPELIFLDIQLSDGLGFHILEKVGNEDYQIIFTTAYSEYAIKAFKTNALDYLLKPIDSEELIAAVAKVSQKKTEEAYYRSSPAKCCRLEYRAAKENYFTYLRWIVCDTNCRYNPLQLIRELQFCIPKGWQQNFIG